MSKKRRIVRVHQRFLLCTFLIVFVVMSALALFTRYQFKKILLNETQSRIKEYEKNILSLFRPLLVSYNYSTIYNSVSTIDQQKSIIYIAVYDKELNLVGSDETFREESDQIKHLYSIELKNIKKTVYNRTKFSIDRGNKIHILDLIIPVYIEPPTIRWGIVRVGISLEDVYSHFSRIEFNILASFFLTLILIYFLLRWMARIIKSPVDSLLYGIDQLASGNLDYRFDIKGNTEFSLLAYSFNNMVQRVKNLQDRLEQWNRQLEKKVEERTYALQRTRQFLENVFNSLTECVVTIDKDGYLASANSYFYKLTGLGNEVIGRSFSSMFLSKGMHKITALKSFLRVLRGEHFKLEQVMKFQNTDLRLEIELCPILGIGNEVEGILAIVRDITNQRDMEQRLLHAQKMESICTLAGGIAHDFNNIFAAILPAIELLKNKITKPEDLVRKLEIIEHSAKRAVELTSQLLMFSRRKDLHSKVLSLNDIVRSVIAIVEETIKPEIKIEIWTDPLLPHIEGDQSLLEQLLMNLILNAKNAIESQGKISIVTRSSFIDGQFQKNHPEVPIGLYSELIVSDTGKGIPEEFIDKIFDPFFTTNKLGVGLGLAVVYGTVKKHNGYIFCTSKEGTGTTFKILIPAAKEMVGEEQTSIDTLPGGSEKILIVDDEPLVREVTKDLLTEIGYVVDIASGGTEALEKIKNVDNKYDLLILDMIMPEMNGLQVLDKIRQFNNDLKVIVISGYDSDRKIEKAITYKNVKYLHKPFDIKDISNLLRHFLDEKQ